MNTAEAVATGALLVGSGVRAIEPCLVEMLGASRVEITLTVFVLSKGSIEVLSRLQECSDRGVAVTILLNDYGMLPEAVKQWFAQSRNMRVFQFASPPQGQLHAKAVVVDRRLALIGSANLTWGGLTGNYEIGVALDGPGAHQLAGLLDRLLAFSAQVTHF